MKKKYQKPTIEEISIDNQISMCMSSLNDKDNHDHNCVPRREHNDHIHKDHPDWDRINPFPNNPFEK